MTIKSARYAALIAKSVDIIYRDGDVRLRASGVLVADSGKAIFIEEEFASAKDVRTVRWEIPYPHLYRVEESAAVSSSSNSA